MGDCATVRLTAFSGRPLEDPNIRETVVIAAQALAERCGVTIAAINAKSISLTVTLEADEIAALGFGAELRRITNAWYEGKYRDGPLWGTPPPGSEPRFD